jgi:IS5 family transposase
MLDVQNTRDAARREDAYVDLLKVTYTCVGYATAALNVLRAVNGKSREKARTVATKLDEFLVWINCVVDQTERRVLGGESVPSEEKVVSIFETHTDIIVKDRRDTLYGHKVFVSAGSSGLITDCVIPRGNPADTSMAVPLLRRHARILGRVPEQAAFDGGFASKENLKAGKALGITDLAFSKKRGLAVTDMTRSSWIYRSLKKFRAGIEGLISFLKRAMGMDRCTWKGEDSFASYVMASVLAGNLLTLARRLAA